MSCQPRKNNKQQENQNIGKQFELDLSDYLLLKLLKGRSD